MWGEGAESPPSWGQGSLGRGTGRAREHGLAEENSRYNQGVARETDIRESGYQEAGYQAIRVSGEEEHKSYY